jgi:hypothetical protein
LSKGANIVQDDLNIAIERNNNKILHILKSWTMAQVIPASNEAARLRGQATLDPEHLLDINDYLGEKGTAYGRKRKRRTRRTRRTRNTSKRSNKSKRRNINKRRR